MDPLGGLGLWGCAYPAPYWNGMERVNLVPVFKFSL